MQHEYQAALYLPYVGAPQGGYGYGGGYQYQGGYQGGYGYAPQQYGGYAPQPQQPPEPETTVFVPGQVGYVASRGYSLLCIHVYGR